VSSEVSQVLEAVLSPDWERTRTVLGYSQKVHENHKTAKEEDDC